MAEDFWLVQSVGRKKAQRKQFRPKMKFLRSESQILFIFSFESTLCIFQTAKSPLLALTQLSFLQTKKYWCLAERLSTPKQKIFSLIFGLSMFKLSLGLWFSKILWPNMEPLRLFLRIKFTYLGGWDHLTKSPHPLTLLLSTKRKLLKLKFVLCVEEFTG